jgi:hypothetical protein
VDRLVLVPDPGARWMEVVAALVDALDVVVINPPRRCPLADARRLAARIRDRHGLLLIATAPLPGSARRHAPWPESVDLGLEVLSSSWQGLEGGDGTLRRREVTIRSSGRRSAGRERAVHLWLPAADGGFAPVGDARPARAVSEHTTTSGAPSGTLAV